MQKKHSRLQTIQRILKNHEIHSQEELLELLKKANLSVTQATLSRDLKILGVAKVSDNKSGYLYQLPPESKLGDYQTAFIKDLQHGIMTIAFSGTLAVIKTRIGHGNCVALALDQLELDGLLGTVAGDDTVLAVIDEKITKTDFLEKLSALVPNLMLL